MTGSRGTFVQAAVKKEAFFESLGDNCEFGFVQRKSGVEDGGLLRWAISPPDALSAAIENDFAHVFEFENLVPSSPRMVRDLGSGLAFHSAMHSENGQFLLEEPERRKIWKDEYEKISYLSYKLLKTLNEGQKILVYKRNSGLSLEDIQPLAEAIRKKGTCRLLYVEADPQGPVGKVRQVSETLFIGTIDKFAPYIAASDCSYDVWNEIIQDMLSHSPPIAAEEMKQ